MSQDTSSTALDSKMELIDFRLFKKNRKGVVEEQIFGINVYKVKEVIFKPDTINKVPTSSSYLEGMVNLRGKVVPIINLQAKLGYAQCEDKNTDYLVITEFNNISCGFMVHQIKKIRRFNWENMIAPPPEIREEYGDLISAITLLENGDIMLIIDFERIIADMNPGYFETEVDWQRVEKQDATKTIMCIDDSSIARQMARKALEEGGYQVIEAINGIDAIKILEERIQAAQAANSSIRDFISVILCDIEMPLMDGFTLTKTIKDNPKLSGIPVVLHSSLSKTIITSRGESVGADDFLTKFNTTLLLEAVNKFI